MWEGSIRAGKVSGGHTVWDGRDQFVQLTEKKEH